MSLEQNHPRNLHRAWTDEMWIHGNTASNSAACHEAHSYKVSPGEERRVCRRYLVLRCLSLTLVILYNNQHNED